MSMTNEALSERRLQMQEQKDVLTFKNLGINWANLFNLVKLINSRKNIETWVDDVMRHPDSAIDCFRYRIIYLSSRAIGQSYQTKKYLSSIIQDSKTLPDGPVLLSPTSVLMAFRKEVIERKPEEFKIACLTDLMSLFPVKHPFYAGFGNRETDIKSYVAVGIPAERILIIDPTGRVENAARIGFETNYNTMLRENVVDHLFPPLQILKQFQFENEEELDASKKISQPLVYSSFTHWRTHPEDLEDLELEKYEKKQT